MFSAARGIGRYRFFMLIPIRFAVDKVVKVEPLGRRYHLFGEPWPPNCEVHLTTRGDNVMVSSNRVVWE